MGVHTASARSRGSVRRRWPRGLTVFALSGLFATAAQAEGTVCNQVCDGRDAALARADRAAVRSMLAGRTVQLHVDDTLGMAWGTLDGGQEDDTLWLDRSYDGGRSWAAGSKLGETRILAGATSQRTVQLNVDDARTRGVGAVRACVQVREEPEIACTPWTRPLARDRRMAAATALMMRYDRATGLFDGNDWWTSANSLTALIESLRRSDTVTYLYAIASTYEKNVDAREGQFRNEYIDDTGWWGLAWLAAYELTGDVRYLDTARADAEHMHAYWDDRCGGGVYWRSDRKVKNAIANSLYIQLNAELSRHIAGDAVYRERAQAGWAWFQSTGMLNGDGLVNDGVDLTTCRNNGDVTWTYNQGVLINALVQLNRLTGEADTLAAARRIGDALTSSEYLSPGGVLTEPNEIGCSGDGASFKGAAVRGLGALNAATGGAHDAYLRRQADSNYANNRDSLDAYGSHWAGPFVPTNHSCQHSVLDLLNTID